MKTTWKQIKETNYEVSKFGYIRNTNTQQILSPNSNGQKKDDYQFVKIEGKKHYIHQLVLEAFEGEKPKGYECDHIDGDKTNNCIVNLRYLTINENRSHKGERHPNSKLNDDKVMLIKKMYNLQSLGLTQQKIGDLFDVKASTISNITTGKSWRHI